MQWGGNPSKSNTEEYDGSSWASSGALITNQYIGGGAGDQNDAVAFTGEMSPASQTTATQNYNGLVWSTGKNMNVKISNSGGQGTSNAAFAAGGVLAPATTVTAITQEYNVSNPVNQGIYCFTKMLGDGAVLDSTSTTTPGGGYGGGY